MSSFLLFLLAATTSSYIPQIPVSFPKAQELMNENIRFIKEVVPQQLNNLSLNDVQLMLQHEAPNLNPSVIYKVLTILKCTSQYHVDHNHILTLIDYSLPSNEKRLWVFDLQRKKLLFHTYVSHGIKSGELMTHYFSNKSNSKASSIGVYQTQKSYFGRDGLSLRLDGLDQSFNDNASSRSVVMHSGWYVDERFIKKYGRPGRSWGCPALPLENSQEIINTIKDKSLMVIYYPNDIWFAKSKFLNCDKPEVLRYKNSLTASIPSPPPDEHRDAILLIGNGYQDKKHPEKPIITIKTDEYTRIFHNPAPLSRMLRRQINQQEYIALSADEVNYLVKNNKINTIDPNNVIGEINFVIPVLKEVRSGYYETQMQRVDLGKIIEIKPNTVSPLANKFLIILEGKPAVSLETSNQFIRWLGL